MEHKDLRRVAAWAFMLLNSISMAEVPLAVAGTGDLDPSFADHGRLGEIPGAVGTARSIALLDEGFVVGGGYFRLWSYPQDMPRTRCSSTVGSFASLIHETGAIDAAFVSDPVQSIETFDMERLADGRILATGRRVTRSIGACTASETLVVFRLKSNGSLDAEFGLDGIFELSEGTSSLGLSLTLESDERIVVAGTAVVPVAGASESRMLVLRLLPDGQLDNSFGDSGVYIDPFANSAQDIRLTPAGTYRVATAIAGDCGIVGLTTDGKRDNGFGDAGIRTVRSSGGLQVACDSLELIAGGKMLVAGNSQEQGFVARLLENATPDPVFQADPVVDDSMTRATAIKSLADGNILVAGTGPGGASIVRLQASGARDPGFGDGGLTWIDLAVDYSVTPTIDDMAVREDGSVTAVGGYGLPFIARLIGNSGGAGPGILGFQLDTGNAVESEREVVLKVRRRGGSDGAVSADYRAFADSSAITGQDFTPTSGTLHWDDGDASEREIVVTIVEDHGRAEGVETFMVTLDGAQGGAGLGLRSSIVEIQPDGAPGGQLVLYGYGSPIQEGSTEIILLARDYYAEGRVCVTLTASSGSATAGADFEETQSVQCWEDQDVDIKQVEIPIVDDGDGEPAETFTIALSNATGGAIVGWVDSVELTIGNSDQSVNQPLPPNNGSGNGRGGGGPAGLIEVLAMLGLLGASNRFRRKSRTRGIVP